MLPRAAALFVIFACGALAFAAAAADLSLEVDLDPATRRFAAVAELVSPGDFAFFLHESLSVRDATADGRPVAAVSGAPVQQRRLWRVPAPRGSKARIEYGGTLPELDPALDYRAVLQRTPPMASAKGTFLPAGSGWYPQPRGAFSYAVQLSLPADQRGLVAGRLAVETLPGEGSGRYVARFEFDLRAEGIDLMAGPYVVREKRVPREGAEPLRLRTYFYSDLDPLADGYLEDSARYIALYSQVIGAYPFSGFSVVASPLPTGFGMPTLTYIGAQVLKLPFIRGTSLGHEVLHNWWGNGVYVDYAKGNWSEGLTTFMADYFYKERESKEAAREMRLAWLRDFAAVPDGAHQPLSAFRSRTHGAQAAIGYGKSAMIFFMLRDAIGEEAFGRGIRRFWERHRFRVASWDDLRAAFEEASGRSLAGFFEQWVQRAGGPRIAVSQARARTLDGRTELALTVTQTAPAYALEAPLEIVSTGRTEIRRIGIEREHRNATLQLDFVPEGVRVDPGLRLWRRLDRQELPPILRQWIIARAPRLLVASPDAEVRLAAESVARSFFESPPREARAAQIDDTREPTLMIGLHRDIDAMLARLGLPARPVRLARGSAQAWTIEDRAGSAPVAVISARDAEALKAVSRPLPHYGSQSYLIFEGAKVIDRGVWPAAAPIVAVQPPPSQPSP